MGDALEFFVKDAFSNSFYSINKEDIYKKYFSYLGNNSNPPDIILKNSDAIEVKKISSMRSSIQLNSSFPEQKLSSDNKLITVECKNCENGKEFNKDMLYSIGVVKNTNLKLLFFVYGDCFAADSKRYQMFKDVIADSFKDSILNAEFAPTNELGRIKRVDPLGVTDLRIRGMWILKNPAILFEDLIRYDENKQDCSVFCLMRKTKFNSFNKDDKNSILKDDKISYSEVEINNPTNPAEIIEAILLRYDKL